MDSIIIITSQKNRKIASSVPSPAATPSGLDQLDHYHHLPLYHRHDRHRHHAITISTAEENESLFPKGQGTTDALPLPPT